MAKAERAHERMAGSRGQQGLLRVHLGPRLSLRQQLRPVMSSPCSPCASAAHALPMFREARQRSTRKQLEKDRLDPKKSHKPEPPVAGPGRLPSLLCSLNIRNVKRLKK